MTEKLSANTGLVAVQALRPSWQTKQPSSKGNLRLGGVVGLGIGLCPLDALHVARPAVLTGHQGAGRGGQALRDRGLLNLQNSNTAFFNSQAEK